MPPHILPLGALNLSLSTMYSALFGININILISSTTYNNCLRNETETNKLTVIIIIYKKASLPY